MRLDPTSARQVSLRTHEAQRLVLGSVGDEVIQQCDAALDVTLAHERTGRLVTIGEQQVLLVLRRD